MLTKGAIGNLVNRYRAVLKKCNLINTFGSLAVASMLVLGGAGMAEAEQVNVAGITPAGTEVAQNYGGWKTITGTGNSIIDSHFEGFTRNTTKAAGGAVIYNQAAETTITGGSFKNNIITTTSNGRGGAIYNTGNLTITGTDFVSNKFDIAKSTAGYGGGAIGTADGGNVTIEKCTFTGNSTTREGGAVYAQQGNVVIKNSTFTGNESTKNRGGAIVVQKGATLTLQGENTFTGNKAASAGGAISVVYPANNEGPTKVIFDTDSVTRFIGNEANYGGALDIVDTFVTKEGSQLLFENNKAKLGGGAISLTTTNASYKAGIEPSVEFNSETSFINNSTEGTGGAIWVYGNTCSVTFNKDAIFSGNTDGSGKNDIHNDGEIIINNSTVTIDGGITSSKDDEGKSKGIITGTGEATIRFTRVDSKVEAGQTTGVKAVASGDLTDALDGDEEAFKKMLADSNGLTFGGMEEGFVAPEQPGEEGGEVTPEQPGEEGGEVTPEQPGEEGGEVTPEQPGEEGGEVTPEQPKPQVQQARNTLMDSALQIASVNTVALDKILTNDVRKRLGDIRSDSNTTGVWMRWDGGRLKGDAGVTNDFNTVQIGGDTKVGKNCRVGVAGSFTHGDSEFARGIAELEGFSFAAYATWMGENGMFADVVARLGHFSNEMKVEGRTGDIDSRVASLSGEYGWRFDLCKQFFIEPQVELAYTYVSSDDLQLGTAKYSFDSVNSLTGRAGAVFGWKLPDERGNIYARASVVQQFLGDAKISGVNGEAFNVQELDGNDTWLEYGIGANVKLTDKTYLWADIERTEGSSIEEEWRGTVGVRFSF